MKKCFSQARVRKVLTRAHNKTTLIIGCIIGCIIGGMNWEKGLSAEVAPAFEPTFGAHAAIPGPLPVPSFSPDTLETNIVTVLTSTIFEDYLVPQDKLLFHSVKFEIQSHLNMLRTPALSTQYTIKKVALFKLLETNYKRAHGKIELLTNKQVTDRYLQYARPLNQQEQQHLCVRVLAFITHHYLADLNPLTTDDSTPCDFISVYALTNEQLQEFIIENLPPEFHISSLEKFLRITTRARSIARLERLLETDIYALNSTLYDEYISMLYRIITRQDINPTELEALIDRIYREAQNDKLWAVLALKLVDAHQTLMQQQHPDAPTLIDNEKTALYLRYQALTSNAQFAMLLQNQGTALILESFMAAADKFFRMRVPSHAYTRELLFVKFQFDNHLQNSHPCLVTIVIHGTGFEQNVLTNTVAFIGDMLVFLAQADQAPQFLKLYCTNTQSQSNMKDIIKNILSGSWLTSTGIKQTLTSIASKGIKDIVLYTLGLTSPQIFKTLLQWVHPFLNGNLKTAVQRYITGASGTGEGHAGEHAELAQNKELQEALSTQHPSLMTSMVTMTEQKMHTIEA